MDPRNLFESFDDPMTSGIMGPHNGAGGNENKYEQVEQRHKPPNMIESYSMTMHLVKGCY